MKTLTSCLVAAGALALIMPSCNGSVTVNEKASVAVTTQDSVSSDTMPAADVPDEFFGAKLGATRDEVISRFAANGLTVLNDISDDDELKFHATEGEDFEFGGLKWTMLNVDFDGDRFEGLMFYNEFPDKPSAMKAYDEIVGTMSRQYKLVEQVPEDSTVYAAKMIYGTNNCNAALGCYKYESIDKRMLYSASLTFFEADDNN